MLEITNDRLVVLVLLTAFILTRVAELPLHRANKRFLEFAGAEKQFSWALVGFYVLSLLVIPAALIENYYRHHLSEPLAWTRLLAIQLIFGGLSLRIWAVKTLGRMWTLEMFFVSGFPLVKSGPYRLLKHPEYFGRLVEGFGICLFLQAKISALAFVLGAAGLLMEIVHKEARQIKALADLEPIG